MELPPPNEPYPHQERLEALLFASSIEAKWYPVASRAIEYYREDLPYHNVDHMFEVTEGTLIACDELEVDGIERTALVLAALFHDADYDLPLEDGYRSKEHRSAVIAHAEIMRNPDTIQDTETSQLADMVHDLILSTHEDHVPQNKLERILNNADIANVITGGIDMYRKTGAFYLEHLILTSQTVYTDLAATIQRNTSGFGSWLQEATRHLEVLAQNKLSDDESRLRSTLKNIHSITIAKVLDIINR